MHLKDLRAFIDALKAIDEVQEINQEVDWNLEVGAIIRHSYDLKAPAPLFNKIKNITPGFRILGAAYGASCKHNHFLARCALALGLKSSAPTSEIVNTLANFPNQGGIKPIERTTGPCKENILIKDQINIERFPIPYIHDNDGGRYFNTLGTLVAKTPDGSWTNWGIARVMHVDKQTLVPSIGPSKDTQKIFSMWQELGKDMPIAIFQGGPPIIPYVSGAAFDVGINEADIIGAFLDKPLDVIKCETIDLCVPTTSEIVVEGFMSIDKTVHEGPMGEYSGNLCLTSQGLKPAIKISAITYRNDPILPVVTAGFPIEENSTVWGLTISGRILDQLKQAKFPVSSCFLLFEAACHLLVVTVSKEYIWHKKKKGNYSVSNLIYKLRKVVFNKAPGSWIPRIMLVADDIDPANVNEVMWALATRCRPDQQLIFPDEQCGQPLISFMSKWEKESLRMTKTILNCLRPDYMQSSEIPIPSRFESAWPETMQQKVLKNWKNYGYK